MNRLAWIIRYFGDFSWGDLRGCTDYDGNKLININMDNDWINMTGRFYLSIISPYITDHDLGIYSIKDSITSYPLLAIYHIVITLG